MSIKVVALVSVLPGKEKDFVAAAQLCVDASRREPGVLRYDLWREQAGEGRFVFDELYTDHAALRKHTESDHFKAIGIAAHELTISAPAIIVTRALYVEEAGTVADNVHE